MLEKHELEAIEILKVLDKYFPKWFEGKNSIKWSYKYSSRKNEDEWQAFFFEDFCFYLITQLMGGWKGPRITPSQRFDYQRDFVWDFKIAANKDVKGRKKKWVPLNDIKKTDQVIGQESGIGYIIAKADYKFDTNGSFRKWRDKFQNRMPSTSNNPRTLKTEGKITDVFAIFIKNTKHLKTALKGGWIRVFNQGHNADGSPRPPKYEINLELIPNEFVIRLE